MRVLLVAPPGEEIAGLDSEALDARLLDAMKEHSVKDAASLVAAETGIKRREVYARAIALGAAGRDAAGTNDPADGG